MKLDRLKAMYLRILVLIISLASCTGGRKVIQQEFVVERVLPDSNYTLLIKTPDDCWTQPMIMGDPSLYSASDNFIRLYYRQTYEIWEAGDTLKLVKK